MFYIGQKVVFIGTGKWEDTLQVYPFLIVPQRNQVYTIRELIIISNTPGMRLYEIHNPRCIFADGYIEIAFQSHEFRPLCEKKTDVSVFQKMLLNEPARV